MNESIGVCMHKKASAEIEISKNSIHQQHFEGVSTHFLNERLQEASSASREKKQLLKIKNTPAPTIISSERSRNLVMMSHMSSTFYCDTTSESSPRSAQR